MTNPAEAASARTPEPRPGIFLLRNPTVADVVDVLTRWFDPDQPFLSAASVFTEVGFEQSHDVDGNPFVVMSVLGKPTSSIIAMPGTQSSNDRCTDPACLTGTWAAGLTHTHSEASPDE